jgi:hypothetical protein
MTIMMQMICTVLPFVYGKHCVIDPRAAMHCDL